MLVANPPPKPLMIFDGDCGFCIFWIKRWQKKTGPDVDYLALQDPGLAAQFPELPREQLMRSVHLVLPNGQVFQGAEAVFRVLSRRNRFLQGLYEDFPFFAPISEFIYQFVASHRSIFSALTRLLWGKSPEPPTYLLTRWLFLRCLGIIYLIAFASLGVQIIGLIGHNGIVPIDQAMTELRQVKEARGAAIYWQYPTVCWLSTSDACLKLQCIAGVVLALLLTINVAPAWCALFLWLLYLSLSTIGDVFLGFQWDALLLEAGLLAIFLAPWKWMPRLSREPPPSGFILFLLRWLLFRLMFSSGFVKLASGDPAWRHLTALNFHYETQPLPTWIGWYAHQMSPGMQKACTMGMFVIELALPFFIFLPRRPRLAAFVAFILLQTAIALTGNYTFFNLLTVALCLLLLDDSLIRRNPDGPRPSRAQQCDTSNGSRLVGISNGVRTFLRARTLALRRLLPQPRPNPNPLPLLHSQNGGEGWPVRRRLGEGGGEEAPSPTISPIHSIINFFVGIPIFIVSILIFLGTLRERVPWPAPFISLYQTLAPLRSVSSYGLFAVMTTNRFEIVIEGSLDGQTWKKYEFKHKPGDLLRRPDFVAPHQPRLDWQMWFAALGSARDNPWFLNLCVRLMRGEPTTLDLLERNPFPTGPPKFIRAKLYQYHFTTLEERKKTGAWWKREYQGDYIPTISLK